MNENNRDREESSRRKEKIAKSEQQKELENKMARVLVGASLRSSRSSEQDLFYTHFSGEVFQDSSGIHSSCCTNTAVACGTILQMTMNTTDWEL